MKCYIKVDENNIVRCLATSRSNLHKDKAEMKTYFVECRGTVGDEYNANKDEWTARPENYPEPSNDSKKQKLINDKIKELAISQLKKEGKLDAQGNLKD